MKRERVLYRSGVRHGVLVLFCGVFLIFPFTARWAPAATEDGKQPLREVYDEAKALAQTPETRAQAIARYRSVIETHLANEKLYQSALRELGACYANSEQVGEGVQFLFDQMDAQRDVHQRRNVMREVIGKIRQKHPEAFRKAVAERETETEAAARKARPRPVIPSKTLSEAILQNKDKEMRENGLAQLQQMLGPESSTDQQSTALATLLASRSGNFDRDPFRELVLPLFKSEDAQVRTWALHCMPFLNAGPRDVPLVVPLADDPSAEVRRAAGEALVMSGKGEYADQIVPALTKLLGDSDPEVVDKTLRCFWGGRYVTPALEERIIQLSREPRHRDIAIYSALSTMPSKSVPVCQRLVEVIQDPSIKRDDRARAAWGLTGDVVEEAKPLVEAGLLAALPEETDEDARTTGFRALRRVATEKSRPYLRSVAASDMESEQYKKLARQIIEDLDGK